MLTTNAKRWHPAYQTYAMSPFRRTATIVNRDEGVVSVEPRTKALVIYGAGRGKELALQYLNDPLFEVWGLNLIVPMDGDGRFRADRWFDIHQRKAQTVDDMVWIHEKCPVPIYVPEDLMGGPMCVRFPHERLEAIFGAVDWACTFSYQIALAIAEGYKTIALCGIELPYGTRRERTVEWASVQFWMGVAHMSGVRFIVPPGSMLGRHPFRYGIEYDEEIKAVNDYLATIDSYGIKERERSDGPSAIDGGFGWSEDE